MTPPQFQPGFRSPSTFDWIILVVGAVCAVTIAEPIGSSIAFVVAHFFLFCNVFRIARPLELLWAVVFITLASGTILHETPNWPTTIAATLLLTVACIAVEMRKPSYHGVLWQRINPQLPQWWAAREQEAS